MSQFVQTNLDVYIMEYGLKESIKILEIRHKYF